MELDMLEGINKYTLEHHYKLIESNKTALQKDVDEYLKNKDNSLEDRWEVWTKYSQTNSGDWIHHYSTKFGEFEEWFHDGDSFNRSETIEYPRILESYSDYLEDFYDGEEVEDSYIEDLLDSMREYLMEKNLRSYKFDW